MCFSRYCGRSVPPSITSTDNLLTLLFVSDSSLAKEGFSANYVSINASMGRRKHTHFLHSNDEQCSVSYIYYILAMSFIHQQSMTSKGLISDNINGIKKKSNRSTFYVRQYKLRIHKLYWPLHIHIYRQKYVSSVNNL